VASYQLNAYKMVDFEDEIQVDEFRRDWIGYMTPSPEEAQQCAVQTPGLVNLKRNEPV
jgi:hypothetical protein